MCFTFDFLTFEIINRVQEQVYQVIDPTFMTGLLRDFSRVFRCGFLQMIQYRKNCECTLYRGCFGVIGNGGFLMARLLFVFRVTSKSFIVLKEHIQIQGFFWDDIAAKLEQYLEKKNVL